MKKLTPHGHCRFLEREEMPNKVDSNLYLVRLCQRRKQGPTGCLFRKGRFPSPSIYTHTHTHTHYTAKKAWHSTKLFFDSSFLRGFMTFGQTFSFLKLKILFASRKGIGLWGSFHIAMRSSFPALKSRKGKPSLPLTDNNLEHDVPIRMLKLYYIRLSLKKETSVHQRALSS
ncbi:hypothetical protein BDF20DRAFT_243502 [Mycotypha africana]|uniref:uncharacterized protein n=1 Tax=Mycotypha africana TaxID=64632 RepID=UPI002300B0E6|nr:uncharacterized protein BDF20DRAFT_243502 [Mycotypha africana]KAI8967145.1 hypothetical protein BDF20DRAFT_243502 [Mycotypha africana]